MLVVALLTSATASATIVRAVRTPDEILVGTDSFMLADGIPSRTCKVHWLNDSIMLGVAGIPSAIAKSRAGIDTFDIVAHARDCIGTLPPESNRLRIVSRSIAKGLAAMLRRGGRGTLQWIAETTSGPLVTLI